MLSRLDSLGIDGDEYVIRVGWRNNTPPQPSHDEPSFKLPSNIHSVDFLVDEEISHSFLHHLLGHNKFSLVVEMAGPAVQPLAVEAVEIFFFEVPGQSKKTTIFTRNFQGFFSFGTVKDNILW